MRKLLVAGASAVLILVAASPLRAFTDQTYTERIIGENKEFIDFMDVCISNFAGEQADKFKDIYQMHFNAEVCFLQSDYRNAFKRVYSSQSMQAGLYAETLEKYLENSKDILDSLAPDIIKSKNARARLYLTLGYRDRTVALTHYTIGDASNPKLYSYKIFKYIEGMKMARRAKRYAFLSLYECQTEETKTRIYNHLFEMERENGNRFFNRFLSKSGDSYIEEMNRTYEESEKDEQAQKASSPGVKEPGDVSGGTGDSPLDTVYERQLEKRVRFRNEKTVARYLLHTEFEKGDDIIRRYVDDFNFKLIKAMFETLGAAPPKDSTAPGVDYKGFLDHHIDNYDRYVKSSLLRDFAGKVKVEDRVDRETPGQSEEDSAEKEIPVQGEKKDAETTPGTDAVKRDAGAPDDKNREGEGVQK